MREEIKARWLSNNPQTEEDRAADRQRGSRKDRLFKPEEFLHRKTGCEAAEDKDPPEIAQRS